PASGRLRAGAQSFPGAEPPDPPGGRQPCSTAFGRLRPGPRYFPGARAPGPPRGGLRSAFGSLWSRGYFPGARAPGPPRGGLRSAFSSLWSRGYFPGARAPGPPRGGLRSALSSLWSRGYFPGARAPGPPRGGSRSAFSSLWSPGYFPGAEPPDPPVGGQPCSPSFGRLRLGPRYFPGARAPGPPRGRLRSAFGSLWSPGYRPRSVTLSRMALVLGGGQAEVGAAGLARLVDQAVRGHDQVLPQLGVVRRIESHLVQGRAHVTQPGVPFRLPDDEARVSHAQPRMAAQLVIGARAAPVLHEEQAQVLLGRPQILARVDPPELRIGGNALVEGMHQAAERFLAADRLVEADRFCCRVHSWHPGYVAPESSGSVGQRWLLSVIVTRRSLFRLSIAALAVIYATCTEAPSLLCMPHTRQRKIDFADHDSR